MFVVPDSACDWPERADTHPFSTEEEVELGYMDEPYQEEPYEELLTPDFIASDRDTLWMVEVLRERPHSHSLTQYYKNILDFLLCALFSVVLLLFYFFSFYLSLLSLSFLYEVILTTETRPR